MNTAKAILGATIVGGGKKKRMVRKSKKGGFGSQFAAEYAQSQAPAQVQALVQSQAQGPAPRPVQALVQSQASAVAPGPASVQSTGPGQGQLPAPGQGQLGQPNNKKFRKCTVETVCNIDNCDSKQTHAECHKIRGGGMRVSVYKKYLDKLTVERLQKMAKSKGIKITKKKDGKTVYVKKATIIKKLCESKHGKA